ncbi:helix-turn-helix transcriptional regulator [Nonomuraea maritima]|uniref:helix-turn-helix transcriptional regulator n=1 Tax=Nonomuraea maritima TaxID=683260 RepID=UPI003717B787
MLNARVPPERRWLPVSLIAGLALCSVVTLTVARAGGTGGYTTHPVSTLALAGGAAGITLLSRRMADRGDRTGSGRLLALAVALLLYLVLSALAVVAVTTGSGAAPVLVGIWGAWWPVPLAVLQFSALRARPRAQRWSILYGVLVAGAVGAMAPLLRSAHPFAGHPPAAPDDWHIGAAIAAATVLVCLVMLTTALLLAYGAARVPAAERTSATLGAAAAALAPLLIVVCMGTAVANDPGDIAPTAGSVAYLVSMGVGCLLGAAALMASTDRTPTTARRLLSCVLGGYAATGVTLAVTWTGAALAPAGPLLSGLAVAAVTATVGAAWWWTSSALTRFAVPVDVPPPPPGLELLSPREREVLALVAAGARDAAIAERLHLSPRTVETHLRRIFTKLGLESDDGRNRRLLAARAWLEATGTDT